MRMCLMSERNLEGKQIVLREDLNVPIQDGVITSDKRIQAALPTIKYALEKGAGVVILSHLGRPEEGHPTKEASLAPVAKRLSELLNMKVSLVEDYINGITVAPGECVLCENIRFLVGEKKNNDGLAKKLAALGDIYVMDAFATAHRAQASTEGAIRFAKYACVGPLMAAELEAIKRILQAPKRPLVAIIGGSKVSTKLQLLENLIQKVDRLIIGGGIANTFLKAAGFEIGLSLYEPDFVKTAAKIMKEVRKHISPFDPVGGKLMEEAHKRGFPFETLGAKVIEETRKHISPFEPLEASETMQQQQVMASIPLPVDVIVAHELTKDAVAVVKKVSDVKDDEKIFDIGPETARRIAQSVMNAGTVVWNGPVGVFEFDQFGSGTEIIAKAMSETPAYTVIGGGDSIAAVEKYGYANKIDYISTAGGAFLEMLEGKVLPAVAALEARGHS